MAEARILPPIDSPNTVYPLDGNVSIGPARILTYASDDDDDINNEHFIPPPMPVPSAPHESLLMQDNVLTPPRAAWGHPSQVGGASQSHQYSPRPSYVPYAMYFNTAERQRADSPSIAESSYQQEPLRERIDSFSYDETTAFSALTDPQDRPQLGHAQEYEYETPQRSERPQENNMNYLFDRLLRELRNSIHDYEVVSGKTRQAEYRYLYSSLSPKQLGQTIGCVSMSHQVQVAVLLARHLVYTSSFTCAHCAEAVKSTSNYFRTNMVEALLPYIHDLARNRSLIEAELTAWELCVTQRSFEGLV
jgi:hypothetical protein